MAQWSAAALLLFYVCRLSLEVEVSVGTNSVQLSCTTRPLTGFSSVLWTLGKEEVHQRVDEEDDLREQSRLFRGRTRMKPDALETGDLTLELINPTLTDQGNYTCVAREGSTEVRRITVELKVKGLSKTMIGIISIGVIIFIIPFILLIVVIVLTWIIMKQIEGFSKTMINIIISIVVLFFIIPFIVLIFVIVLAWIRLKETEGLSTIEIIGISIISVIIFIFIILFIVFSVLAYKRMKQNKEKFLQALKAVFTPRPQTEASNLRRAETDPEKALKKRLNPSDEL